MNLELQQRAKEKRAEGLSIDEIARLFRVRQITVAQWLGVELVRAHVHVPVVPDVEGDRIYRVIVDPTLTHRQEGGWTATGEVILRTKFSSRAIALCGETKNSCVVENHDIVIRYNKVRGIHYAAPNIGGFRFGRQVNG